VTLKPDEGILNAKKRECSFAQRQIQVFPHCGSGNRSIDSIEVFRPGKGGEMVQELDLQKFRTLLMNKRNQILDYRTEWGGTFGWVRAFCAADNLNHHEKEVR
jgi:hypothetical protein